uniref:SbsA Ig-like domain-containing protein n=1 Tax=Alexandrium monilatum TaxID=311494 RepID=A0A7S4R3R9_9DINO
MSYAAAFRQALLAATLLILGVQPPLAAAQVFDPSALDFHNLGEPFRELDADVVYGQIAIQGSIETGKLGLLGSYIGNTVAGMCPTKVKVIARVYQDIKTIKQPTITLQAEFYTIPTNRNSFECQNGFYDHEGFKQLLHVRVKIDGDTAPAWDPKSWRLELKPEPILQNRLVRWPTRLPKPAATIGPGGGGVLNPGADKYAAAYAGPNAGPADGTGVLDPNCRSASSACVCATRTSCAWRMYEGSYRCIGLGGPATSISCDDCGLQSHCSRDQAQACDLHRDPCECALSTFQCRWDLSSMSCIPKGGQETDCTICSRQDNCDSPQVSAVWPAKGSRFGVSAKRAVTITFDRNVILQPVMNGVSFLCTGDVRPSAVPRSLVAVRDKVLTIELSRIPRMVQADCEMALAEGAVADASGLNFRGTAADWYAFKIQDTSAPVVVDYDPRNAAQNLLPAGLSATMVFNEPISRTMTCEVTLTERGLGVATFRMDSSAITLDRERKRLTVDLDGSVRYGMTYSLVLPAGCVRDSTGNRFQGLGEGVYILSTKVPTFTRALEQDSVKVILGACLGAAGALICLVAFIVLSCRVRGIKSNFADRIQQTASRARRFSQSSMDGLWTEFSRPRRFSFDAYAMTGWGSKTAAPADPEQAARPAIPEIKVVEYVKPGVAKVHPEDMSQNQLALVQQASRSTSGTGTPEGRTAWSPRRPRSGSASPRPLGDGRSPRSSPQGSPRPNMSALQMQQGPRTAGDANGGPHPPQEVGNLTVWNL